MFLRWEYVACQTRMTIIQLYKFVTKAEDSPSSKSRLLGINYNMAKPNTFVCGVEEVCMHASMQDFVIT